MLSISNAFCIALPSAQLGVLSSLWRSFFSASNIRFDLVQSWHSNLRTYFKLSSYTPFNFLSIITSVHRLLFPGKRQVSLNLQAFSFTAKKPRSTQTQQPESFSVSDHTRMSLNHTVQGTDKYDSKVRESHLPPTTIYNGL
jgi:hypothetical protein